MNKPVADQLQKTLRIPLEQIVREDYEMIVLKRLFESEVGSSFVFKGGTALRLAYGCPRFSEDLDFSMVGDFDKEACNRVLRSIESEYDTLTIKELIQKQNTYFALFQVKESFLVQNFSIKFEASTRRVDGEWKRGDDFELVVLNSRVTSLTVLAQVATLERIEKDKLSIEPKRVRDAFDLWFIGQKLGKHTPMNFQGFDPQTIKREMHKFLPESERKILEPWLPQE
jgi:predicted nucleotidyltransferase component of viral defense system